MLFSRQVIVQGSPSAIGRLQVQQQQQQQGGQQQAAVQLPQVLSATGGTIADRAAGVVAQANANAATMVVASPQPTVVSVANLTPGQLQTAQKIVSQSGGIQRTLVSANTGKPLTQQQINLFKQQAMLKKTQEQAAARARLQQQQQPQQQATVVATTSTGQKVSVAVTHSGQLAAISSAAGVSAVTVVTQAGQVAGQQAKAHLIRQLNAPVVATGAKTTTANVRSMTEGEMKLILARQQQQQQQGQQQGQQQQGSAQQQGAAKAQIASIQVPAGGQPLSAAAQQLLQAGIQIQTTSGGTPVAALVKPNSQQQAQQQQQQAVTIPLQGMNVNAVRAAAIRGGQVATASPQQLTIIHRQLLQQKRQQQQQAAAAAAVAAGGSVVQQLPQAAKGTLGSVVAAAGKGGGTQLIVSGAAAGGPGQLTQKVTVQQIQQLVKQAQQQQQQQQQQPGGGGLQQQQLQGIPQAVLKQAAAAGQAGTVQARVIPVSSAGGGRGPQIQVCNALHIQFKNPQLHQTSKFMYRVPMSIL